MYSHTYKHLSTAQDWLTFWDLIPSMLTTNPTPQASDSNCGSYRPCLYGRPLNGFTSISTRSLYVCVVCLSVCLSVCPFVGRGWSVGQWSITFCTFSLICPSVGQSSVSRSVNSDHKPVVAVCYSKFVDLDLYHYWCISVRSEIQQRWIYYFFNELL